MCYSGTLVPFLINRSPPPAINLASVKPAIKLIVVRWQEEEIRVSSYGWQSIDPGLKKRGRYQVSVSVLLFREAELVFLHWRSGGKVDENR